LGSSDDRVPAVILLSLPAGVWVDRLRRRPILIVGDLGRALVLLSIPIAFAFNALTIWQLYIVGFVNGCLTVFFDVAYQSYLPSIVERDQLVEGQLQARDLAVGRADPRARLCRHPDRRRQGARSRSCSTP
jgi:MFS family permease